MSLILDALKKSEAERQLGRAPGLTTPMPLRRGETNGPVRAWRRYALWLAIAGLVATIAVWLARSTPAEVATAPAPQNPSLPAASAAAGADEASPRSAASFTAPAADSISEVRSEAPVPKPELTPAQTAGVAPAVQPPPGVVEASVPTPQDPEFDSVERETEAIVAPAPLPASSTPPPPPALETPFPPRSAPAATTIASEPVEAPAEALPRLDQLGGPQRASLPPLKQTMHVYAQAPAARFVLIDGRRYREGDQLSSSLQLLEIRRDGTVLQFDGLRFLLPRP